MANVFGSTAFSPGAWKALVFGAVGVIASNDDRMIENGITIIVRNSGRFGISYPT
jgi:hypothetical protein